MGTNAIPRLLRMLQQPNAKWSGFVWSTLSRQHLVKVRFAPGNWDLKAYKGLSALGPQASNAVPALIAVFNRKVSPLSQQAVPVILGSIGRGPVESVPFLLRAINHTNDIVRCNAICALSNVHPDPGIAVPVLTGLLKDPDLFVRASAADALRSYGHVAQTAFPALLEAWRKEPPPPAASWMLISPGHVIGESWEVLGTPPLFFRAHPARHGRGLAFPGLRGWG
jgi:hypothetical protein